LKSRETRVRSPASARSGASPPDQAGSSVSRNVESAQPEDSIAPLAAVVGGSLHIIE
jgi:hypothetical protein